MSSELAPPVYEAFSKLGRQLRALELPHGLTNERLSTLASVAAHEPIALSVLADDAIVSLPTMSRMVAKLEAEDLVQRRESKHGDREILISTTAKGREAYQQAAHRSLSQLKDALRNLEPEQLAAVRTLLAILDEPKPAEQAVDVERLYTIAPVGLCYIDSNLRFLYINDWLANINGFSVEAHLGKTVNEVIQDVAAGAVPQLRRVLETGEPIIDGQIEVETAARPGDVRRYMHNYFPDKAEDGTVRGVSCVVQDITERE